MDENVAKAMDLLEEAVLRLREALTIKMPEVDEDVLEFILSQIHAHPDSHIHWYPINDEKIGACCSNCGRKLGLGEWALVVEIVDGRRKTYHRLCADNPACGISSRLRQIKYLAIPDRPRGF